MSHRAVVRQGLPPAHSQVLAVHLFPMNRPTRTTRRALGCRSGKVVVRIAEAGNPPGSEICRDFARFRERVSRQISDAISPNLACVSANLACMAAFVFHDQSGCPPVGTGPTGNGQSHGAPAGGEILFGPEGVRLGQSAGFHFGKRFALALIICNFVRLHDFVGVNLSFRSNHSTGGWTSTG